MTRKSRKNEEPAQDPVVAELSQEKAVLIVEGKLNDDHCTFSVQINTGPTKGMVHKVNGKPNIVHDDLRSAFQEFRPHLAALQDALDNVDADSFGEVKDNQKVDLFHVTGFKIKGAGESESISLSGSMHSMTASGRNNIDTAFVSLESADYKWYNELRDSAEKVRKEIELYNDGKCTPPEEEKVGKPQAKMEFEEQLES